MPTWFFASLHGYRIAWLPRDLVAGLMLAPNAIPGQLATAIRKGRAPIPEQPGRGTDGPASIAAQLDRQPTPASVRRAEKRAQVSFNAAMARAKRLHARGNRAECTRALTAAKRMYNL